MISEQLLSKQCKPRAAVRLRTQRSLVPSDPFLQQAATCQQLESLPGVGDKSELEADAGDQEVERFVFNRGPQYDSYLASEDEFERFWSSDQQGLISYTRWGRQVLVRGGLIAHTESKEQLLAEFLKNFEPKRHAVHFFGAGDEDLSLFRKYGMQVTKWGEEPIVDLVSCTWGGKSFEWLRRQTNYCQRNGIVASEIVPAELSSVDWQSVYSELLTVAAESLNTKIQSSEMEFFEGQITSHRIGYRRLFVARSQNGMGRMEGFVLCNPILGGERWATEMYRHRTDSIRGTVPFLFHYAMQQFQREGVESATLCLLPGVRCEPIPGDSACFRRYLRFGGKYLNFIFDVAGINHFKSRFRPRYENRYVCSTPRASLSTVLAYQSVLKICNFSGRKCASIVWDRLNKRAERKNLASQKLACQVVNTDRPLVTSMRARQT